MIRVLGIGLALTTLMLVPSAAFADEASPPPLPPAAPPAAVTESTTATVDTVHLRSGGMFRGRVSEIVPGDHVTVILPSGETRRIPWSDVERVIVASTAVPPAPSSPSAAGPPAMVGPRARVHIKASGRVTLYRRAAGTTDLVAACEAPCDEELPLGDTYRVGGSGLTTTHEFTLAGKPGGSVEITVDGPSWAGIVGGGLLTLGGGFTAYVGLLLTLAGGAADSSSRSSYSANSAKEVRNVGLGALAVGAVMIGVGLAIVYPSLKTDLTQQAGGASKDAFVRSPTWLTAGPGAETRSTPLMFPVLGGTF